MLILASSSPYRRELLARLQLPFESVSPDVDESPLPNESPRHLARRLAQSKAETVIRNYRDQGDVLVIGSDQVAAFADDIPVGKPGTHERAREQLRRASGQTMQFFTAVAVMGTTSPPVVTQIVETRVHFRTLDDAQIERYLTIEKPYDCAGAAKCEGLGICLLEAIECPDPTALIGLPLIALCTMLGQAGLQIPAAR